MNREEDTIDEECVGEEQLLLPKMASVMESNANEEEESSSSKHQRVRSDFSFFAPNKQTKKGGNHHRRQSSIAQLVGTIGTGLGTIAEDVQDAAGDVRRGWLEELEHANDGSLIFLETSLMRSLSLLPEDMEKLVDQLPGTEPPVDDTIMRKLGPYLSLLGAVAAVSSNGTALTLETGVAPGLKLYWRMMATALVLAPFAIRGFWKEGFPKLNLGQWATMGLAVTCYVAHNLLFVTALCYTTIGNAVLFANTQAVILLAGKALTGNRIEVLEYMGAIVAFGGAILCATDEQRDNGADIEKDAVFGDMLAMISALFGVGYLTFAKAVRPHTSVVIFMFIVMSVGSFLVLLYLALIQEHTSFSIHPYNGLFGWMALRYENLPLEIWIVLVCNIVGTMGFVRSMKYFDSMIIAISTLLEPMAASIIASIMHVGVLPGPKGWVGNFLVIIGTFGVVYPSASKGENGGH
jgi:drug/metabolite transporter (DMT)-like permease